MSGREFVRAVEAVTALLPIPMDLKVLVANLAAALDRSVEVSGAPFSFGSVTGALVLDLSGGWTILYDAGADPAHQLHIVLHEIAHIVLKHPLLTITAAAVPQAIRSPLRCPYPAEFQREAEQLAFAVQAMFTSMPPDLTERGSAGSILL